MRLIPLLVTLTIGASSFAQPVKPGPIPPGTSTISGVLIDARTRQPIAGCSVGLIQVNVPRNALTKSDATGAYAFTGIADGEYYLNTLCESHLSSCYRGPGTEPSRCDTVAVVVDQRKTNIDFNLIQGATAKGRVVDAGGRPIAGATVRLGQPRFDARFAPSKPAQTGRDGSFTLTNLPVGGYLMEVDLPQAPGALRPPIVYFPGVLTFGDADFVELVDGEITNDLTIVAPRLADNVLTVRVVTIAQALSGLEVAFVRVLPLVTRPVALDGSGIGTIKGLAPGQYFLTAQGRSQDQKLVAHELIEFAGGEQEALLYLQPAARISGRIVGDKGAPVDLAGMRVGATWLQDGVEVNPLDITEAPVTFDGTFMLDGLFGTRRLQLIGLDPEWQIRSIVQDRSDVTGSGVSLAADSEAKVVITLGRR
jgi:hypothetical protein